MLPYTLKSLFLNDVMVFIIIYLFNILFTANSQQFKIFTTENSKNIFMQNKKRIIQKIKYSILFFYLPFKNIKT